MTNAIHPPKRISSYEGLGLNTTKSMHYISDAIGIGTEVWNELAEPWRESSVIIAEQGYVWQTKWEMGKPYLITKFHNANNELVGIYCDISRPVVKTSDGFAFDDLYLDIWQPAGGAMVILDEDELEAAVAAGYISLDDAAMAYEVAQKLMADMKSNPSMLDF